MDVQGEALRVGMARARTTGKGTNVRQTYCAQGNILVGPQVVDALAKSFESSAGRSLASRLMDALDAAQAAGGDARGMQSAAMVVTRALGGAGGFSDRVIDIRVDDSRTPLVDLRRLLSLYEAGQADHRSRIASSPAGDAQAALQTALAARDKVPENDNAWVALANIHLKAGRKADALAAIAKAIELNAANKSPASQEPQFRIAC